MNLLLGEAGAYIVKYATLGFLVMLISGIFLWWPRNKAAHKQRFRFRWKKTRKWKRRNYDLHNIPGFYAAWIVVFMAITGPLWSFEWFSNGLYIALSGGEKRSAQTELPTSKADSRASRLDVCLQNIQIAHPSSYAAASRYTWSTPRTPPASPSASSSPTTRAAR